MKPKNRPIIDKSYFITAKQQETTSVISSFLEAIDSAFEDTQVDGDSGGSSAMPNKNVKGTHAVVNHYIRIQKKKSRFK